MTPIPNNEFLVWLKELNLIHDREWGYIHFPDKGADDRFWLCPTEVPRLLYFVHTMISELGDWESLTLYRQGGTWTPRKGKYPIGRIKRLWLAPFNLPSSGRFALRFQRSEIDAVVSLFALQQMFGMCVWDDTYAVPDHGDILLRTSHHEVVDVGFRKKGDVRRFVARMKKEKFSLPTEIPDETFVMPPWMKKKA